MSLPISSESIWSWSLRLFRFRRITVSAHWTLFLICLFDLVQWLRIYAALGMPWWLMLAMSVAMTAILFGSILLHEFGHAFAARGQGGHCDRIVMWMLGGLAECEAPQRPRAQFIVAAAGPLVTLLLCLAGVVAFTAISGGGWTALGAYALASFNPLAWFHPGIFGDAVVMLFDDARSSGSAPAYVWHAPALLLAYLGAVNAKLLLFNLLPCFPLDGGRMFLSTSWPLFGLRRAMSAALWVGYPVIALMLAVAIWQTSFGLLLIGIWLLSALIQEHAQLRMYNSVAFGLDLAYDRVPSWWDRTQRDRHRQRAEARARAEQEEQERVDRLLEKVGKQGLASLTRHERAVLEAYSRKERDRLGSGR